MSSSEAEGPRFSQWTPTDHQAPLWILISLSLIYSCSFLFVRLVVKIKRWALDDVVLGVAYVISFAQWAMVYAALDRGAGRSVSSPQTSSLGTPAKLIFASKPLTLLGLGLAKCSCVLFLRLLFTKEDKRAWRLCTALVTILGCWTIASTLTVSIGYSPNDALSPGKTSQSTSEITRWATVTGIDVFLELVLILLAAYLFTTLQMSVRTKLIVISAFCFRLGVAGLFIAYLLSYISFREHGRPSIDAVDSLVLQQALLAYSLMSATIPCLKSFLGRFRTDDLTKLTERERMHSHGLREYGSRSTRSHVQSYALSSMDRQGGIGKARRAKNQLSAMLQPDSVYYSTHVCAERRGDNGGGSIRSSGSGQMIIHRTVEFDAMIE